MKIIKLQYLNNMIEEVNPSDIDLSSFNVKDSLNIKIWTFEGKLKPEVKGQLLKIAEEYKKFLEIPWVEYTDVILTGSLANYNWSEFSDIDLHIILNTGEISDNKDLTEEYLSSKKKLWNEEHNIKIYGFDVECYTQDVNEKHTSTGVYSVDKNKWLISPRKYKPHIDKNIIKRKSADIMSYIDTIIELYNNKEYDEVLKKYNIIWDKIKKMRQIGLDRTGEFSYENIVFKVLRRTGYIEELINVRTKSYDKVNSL